MTEANLKVDGGEVVLIVGAATFLLPCGFTQAMQLYAISLGSPAAVTDRVSAPSAGSPRS